MPFTRSRSFSVNLSPLPDSEAPLEALPLTEDGIATDHWWGKKLYLRQIKKGYRAGTDSVLVAASHIAAQIDHPGALLIDVGAGSGAIGLALALRFPRLQFILAERNPKIAQLARENILLNQMENRGRVVEGDVLQVLHSQRFCQEFDLHERKAALVVTNPPFYMPEEVQISPEILKAEASVLGPGIELKDWLEACLWFLASQGQFIMIHRPQAVADILTCLTKPLGNIEIRGIYPQPHLPAVRILVSGIRDSHMPLTFPPSLILHEFDGRFTPKAAYIHQGHALEEFKD